MPTELPEIPELQPASRRAQKFSEETMRELRIGEPPECFRLREDIRDYLQSVAPTMLLADLISELGERFNLDGHAIGLVLAQWIKERK